MTESYERHHWQGAQVWAQVDGEPEEISRQLVEAWNQGSGLEFGYRRVEYPTTPAFISALANLIRAARRGKNPVIIEDGCGDSLCQACRQRRC